MKGPVKRERLRVWPSYTAVGVKTDHINHFDSDAAPCGCITHYCASAACTSVKQQLIDHHIKSYIYTWLYLRECDACGMRWYTAPQFVSKAGWAADWSQKVTMTLEKRGRAGLECSLESLIKAAESSWLEARNAA